MDSFDPPFVIDATEVLVFGILVIDYSLEQSHSGAIEGGSGLEMSDGCDPIELNSIRLFSYRFSATFTSFRVTSILFPKERRDSRRLSVRFEVYGTIVRLRFHIFFSWQRDLSFCPLLFSESQIAQFASTQGGDCCG